MKTSRFTQCFASLVVASGMALVGGPAAQGQTAGQDMHQAGSDTTNAAKDAGSGVKKGTTGAYHKTKQGTKTAANKTKEGTTKGYDKTKEGTTKGYDRTKEGAEHVTGSRNASSTRSKDKAKETRQTTHDENGQDRQKLDDSGPHS